MEKYIFIGKTIFFPKEKIVTIGDLHLGYEEALKSKGIDIPLNQFSEFKTELENTLNYIKTVHGKIEKIIFLGDIKHSFGFLQSERKYMNELLRFVRKFVENENKIIFIRGNHERNDKNEKFQDFYIEKDIIFVHGHKEFLEIYDKTINLIVMAHLHPTITLMDKMRLKREKYKCFLQGKFKKKEIIILPSFLSITEGVSTDEFSEFAIDFSIIPQTELLKFKVFACQPIGEEALNFGILEKINS